MMRPIPKWATMTPQQLREGIANLNGILASGARNTVLGGQSVTFNTSSSIIEARNDLQAQLNAVEAMGRRSKQSYAYYAGRGYHEGRG